jgi:cell wall-associated NlpC family hydrolase
VAGPAAAAPESGYGTAPPTPTGRTHRYDADAAARYALRWSDTPVRDGEPVPRYNPDYPRLDHDAANFVSQALEAGGWSRREGTWDPAGSAWTRAADLYRFATDGRARAWARSTPLSDDIWHLEPGDLLFADWTSDGTIDHVMIVVGLDTVLGFTEPTISQHSPHRHNLPLSVAIKIAALEHGKMSFYPVTPHASYRESATRRPVRA